MRRLIIVLALFSILASVSQVEADTPTPREGNVTWIQSDEVSHVVIAKFRDRVPPGLVTAKTGNRSNLARFNTDDPHGLIELLRRRPDVEDAVLSPKAKLFAGPNDPAYSPYQWHLDNPTWEGVNFQDVWELPGQPKGLGVRVAIIDTGVAWDNPNATDKPNFVSILSGSDIFNGDNNPTDDHGHGTHVSGTIAQATNNNHGVAGVASGATIVPLKVLDNTGSGTEVEVVEGIYLAANAHAPCVSDGPRNADIINMSLGFPAGTTPAELPGMETAIECAVSRGITVFAASGNDGSFNVSYPAAFPAVIAVGATGIDDFATWFSNGGSALDVTAPGGENCSGFIGFICQFGPSGSSNPDKNSDGVWDGVLQQTFNFGSDPNDPANWGFYLAEGTSMASPHAAGVAALLYGLNPSITPAQVRNILQATAEDRGDPGRDDTYGFGIVDALAAVNALGPVPTPTSCSSCTPTPTATPVPPTATPTQTPSPTPTPTPIPGSSIWPNSQVGGDFNPGTNPVEVGVRFRANQDGNITHLRFYKHAGNTGTHVGHLWTNAGTLLATATFSGETSQGWQVQVLASPVAISANTTYVASYSTVGFGATQGYFASADTVNGPLRALRDGFDGANGIYVYAPGQFPFGTYNSTNYWVDVVFAPGGVTPTPTPTATPTATPTVVPPTPTPTTPPAAQCNAPTIGSTSDTGLSVSFSWNSVAGVSQYAVQRRSADGWETRGDVVGMTFSGDDLASDPDWRVYATFGSCATPGIATVFDP